MPHDEKFTPEETPLMATQFGEKCYRYKPYDFLCTEMVKSLVVDNEPSCWLLDIVGKFQARPEAKNFPFQHWELTVHDDQSATLIMKEDGELNSPVIFKEEIPHTEIRSEELDFVFTSFILMDGFEYCMDYLGINL